MKRIAALLVAVAGALALFLLLADDAGAPRPPAPPPRVPPVAASLVPGGAGSERPLDAAPAPAPSAVPDGAVASTTTASAAADADAPSPDAASPDPQGPPPPGPAPASDAAAAGAGPGGRPVRSASSPFGPDAWVPGAGGAPVPLYEPAQREAIETAAADVQDRRGTVVGRLQRVDAEQVSGFAYDWRRPDVPVQVEVYVDGARHAVVRSDAARPGFRPDDPVAARGFRAPSVVRLVPGRELRVQAFARLADDARPVELPGSPWVLGADRPPRGRIEEAAEAVAGWAVDPDRPDAVLEVEVTEEGRPIGRFRADGPAPPDHDGHAGHWFVAPLAPSPPRVVCVQAFALDGPFRVECEGAATTVVGRLDGPGPPPNQLPCGAVAFVTPTQITGWALDPDVGDAPIEVEVAFDGVPSGRLRADREFAALVQSGISSPFHLWLVDVPPPLLDGRTHVLSVLAVNVPEGANVEVDGSPVTFTSATNTPPSGWVDVADATALAGWAYDADAGARPIEVELWVDGELWRVVTADGVRPDLVPVVCPEPAHGWWSEAPAAFGEGGFHTMRALARDHPGGPAQELAGSPRELGDRRPWLGVSLDDDAGLQLRVVAVREGSPAELAGVRGEDRIATHNGARTPGDRDVFMQWIGSRRVGEAIELGLDRRHPTETPARETLPADVQATIERLSAPLPAGTTAEPEEVALADGRVGVLTATDAGLRQEWFTVERVVVYPVLADWPASG